MLTTIQFEWTFNEKNRLTLKLTVKATKRLTKGGYNGQQRRAMKAKKNPIEEDMKDTMNDDHHEACAPPPSITTK